MPIPPHLYITGTRQGKIEGPCPITGREGSIIVQQFDHEILIPRSTQTGQPTGKRVHNPLVIVKAFDKASPKLYQALTTGEILSEVVLKFFRITPLGKEEHYFTIKLEDAVIQAMAAFVPSCLDQNYARFTHMEKVSFVYAKIIWTWEEDGIESEDEWKI
ncbi:MAG: Hcp family type VI secretion system effector [Deltaproteobacteria bacterium]|nr:Hcp family type VI secretion system effector [Deltaproteobacteria bacterium]